jgi:OOP family OmpA-OmpF porin
MLTIRRSLTRPCACLLADHESFPGRQANILRTLRRPALALLLSTVLLGCAAPGDEPGTSLCPDVAAGIPVDADGCPLYSDADAVPDYLDRCPGTEPGIRVDASGCPLDSDVDGVADGSDACPSTPVGVRVNAVGCPLAGERIAIVTNVNFDFDRADVRENVKERLDRVIALLKEMPAVDVQIIGYTDDIGSAEYNLALSLRRAESVREYVVARGIEDARLSVAGRGKTQPLVSNATPEGRAVNRRVEFVVR